jgi:hypothetical protein
MFIYDYSSFTSNLTELKYFLQEFASWCEDTSVNVVDSHFGPTTVSLGSLISSYNDDVNIHPEMDMSGIFNCLHDERPYIEKASRSGLLGVYGNIVFSTFLHALVLSHICGSEDLCNVVGDDAIGIVEAEEWTMLDILEAVRLLGDVEETKQESWIGSQVIDDSHGWQFLKRPLDRLGNTLFTGRIIDVPLAVYVAPPGDNMHTQQLGSFSNRLRSFLMQCSRLLDRLHDLEHKLSEEEINFALQYLRTCYHHFHIPLRGALPPVKHPRMESDLHMAIPIIARESVSKHWHILLVEEMQNQGFSLPRHTFHQVDPKRFFTIGDSFYASSSQLMDLAVDLGWATKELEKTYVLMTPDVARLYLRFLDGEHTLLYLYTYTVDPPIWWKRVFDTKWVTT